MRAGLLLLFCLLLSLAGCSGGTSPEPATPVAPAVAASGTATTLTLTLSTTPAANSFGQQVALTAALSPFSAGGHSTDGETITFVSGGTFTMASNPISSLLYGYDAFGDSNTAGAGYSPAYPAMLSGQYSPAGAPFNNYGVSGYDCLQQNYLMFYYLNPGTAGNPAVTDMIGTNDEGALDGGAAPQLAFTQCQFAANARAALSASGTIMAASAEVQSTGSWAVDPTFPAFNGLVTTAANSSLAGTVELPRGVLYVWYGVEHLYGGGTFQVLIDGAPATDTISSLASLPTGLGAYVYSVSISRFVTTPGSHAVAVTVTSPSGAGNPVEIYAFGAPPLTPASGPGGPYVFLGGVMHYENDPDDVAYPGLGIANSLNRQVAAALDADGLNVHFVDVRSYVDPYLGMLSSPVGNCIASWNPGFHVNNCGTVQLAQAFADAMGLTASSSGAPAALGTETLSSGVATLNLSSLPVGVSGITAVYAGDTNLESATSISSFVRVAAGTAGSPAMLNLEPRPMPQPLR